MKKWIIYIQEIDITVDASLTVSSNPTGVLGEKNTKTFVLRKEAGPS